MLTAGTCEALAPAGCCGLHAATKHESVITRANALVGRDRLLGINSLLAARDHRDAVLVEDRMNARAVSIDHSLQHIA